MKKIIYSILILTVLLSSCEKFLDINPINKAYEDELFTDRSGFETALAGVYVSMNHPMLYGREMKYGFMESLVGSYNVTNSAHEYYRSFRFEYDYERPKLHLANIWSQFYLIINQCNIMLDNLGKIQNDPYYDIIRGELLGLRAFAHFQLLKLFGPAISNEGLQAAAIPYKDAVTYTAVKFGSAAEVIGKLNKDLLEARALLSEDPIRTNSRTANLNQYAYEKYNSLIDYRGTRMNYYAVVALQAMVAQWGGDLDQASLFAEEIITELNNTNNIRLAVLTDLNNLANRRMPMENIFALFSQDLLSNVWGVHPPLEDTRSASTTPLLFPNYNWLNTNLYNNAATYGSVNDFRWVNWFGRASTSAPWKLLKYIYNPDYSYTDNNYKPLFENKVISLHTIYMIAAEYYATANPSQAIAYLNRVRNARDIGTDILYQASMTPEEIKNLIFAEMRKENIGEGYLFMEYKRLFRPIDRATAVQPSLTIFRLPVPDDELLYNPQN